MGVKGGLRAAGSSWVCPSALEKPPHSQRKNLLLPGVPLPVKAVICVGKQCSLLLIVRPAPSPWEHSHPQFSSGICVRREEWGEVLPCANPVLSAPITAAHHHLRNKSISGMMKLVFSVFQAGMALYKIVPKNPYYFWSVMSLIMQVCAVLGLAVALF